MQKFKRYLQSFATTMKWSRCSFSWRWSPVMEELPSGHRSTRKGPQHQSQMLFKTDWRSQLNRRLEILLQMCYFCQHCAYHLEIVTTVLICALNRKTIFRLVFFFQYKLHLRIRSWAAMCYIN